MDRRRKHIDQEAESKLREQFYADIQAGGLSIAEAVKKMRRLSRLTQKEFSEHRKVALGVLKQIEAGTGNPKVETLNRISTIFGLEVGFVTSTPNRQTLKAMDEARKKRRMKPSV
ncbi:MAG: hypothetical protein BroJett038_24090 [Chloroflexota bacterium]|jgi:transcriptional regulator with XRE-family HTH domain|nr:MAG: hypothetical protein BroJett038_24090 [Chloroflexota bacterium]